MVAGRLWPRVVGGPTSTRRRHVEIMLVVVVMMVVGVVGWSLGYTHGAGMSREHSRGVRGSALRRESPSRGMLEKEDTIPQPLPSSPLPPLTLPSDACPPASVPLPSLGGAGVYNVSTTGDVCSSMGTCRAVVVLGGRDLSYPLCQCKEGHVGRGCEVPLGTLLGGDGYEGYLKRVSGDAVGASIPGSEVKISPTEENQHILPAQLPALLRPVVPLPLLLAPQVSGKVPSGALSSLSEQQLYKACDDQLQGGGDGRGVSGEDIPSTPTVVAERLASSPCAWLAMKRVVTVVSSINTHYPHLVPHIPLVAAMGTLPDVCVHKGDLMGWLVSDCMPSGWLSTLLPTATGGTLTATIHTVQPSTAMTTHAYPSGLEALSGGVAEGWNGCAGSDRNAPFLLLINPFLVARMHEHTNLPLMVSQLLLPGAADIIGFQEVIPIPKGGGFTSQSYHFHSPVFELSLRRWSLVLSKAAFGYRRHTSYTILSDTSSVGALIVRSRSMTARDVFHPQMGVLSLLDFYLRIKLSNDLLLPTPASLPGPSVHPSYVSTGTCAECLIVYTEMASAPWGLGLLSTITFNNDAVGVGNAAVLPMSGVYINTAFVRAHGVETIQMKNPLSGGAASLEMLSVAVRPWRGSSDELIRTLLGHHRQNTAAGPYWGSIKDGSKGVIHRRMGGVPVGCVVSGGMYGPSKHGLYSPYCHRVQRLAMFYLIHTLWTHPTLLGGGGGGDGKYLISVHAGNLFGALRFNKELLWETDGDLDVVSMSDPHEDLLGRFERLLQVLEDYRFDIKGGTGAPVFVVKRATDGKPWYASILLGGKVDFQLNARSVVDPLTRGKPTHHHNVTTLYNGVRVGLNGFQNPWLGVRSAPGHEYGRLYLSMQKWTPQRRSANTIRCKANNTAISRWCLPDCNQPRLKADHNYCDVADNMAGTADDGSEMV